MNQSSLFLKQYVNKISKVISCIDEANILNSHKKNIFYEMHYNLQVSILVQLVVEYHFSSIYMLE